MWKSAVPWLAVLASSVVILVQRTTITNLQRQLSNSIRSKRSTEAQNGLFLPVYAQISRKAMHRMCLQKRYTMLELEQEIEKTTKTAPSSPVPRKTQRSRMRSERKRCSSEVKLSEPVVVGIRPNSMGAALRDRHTYYVTEFDLGYSMLVFPSARSLNHSEPKSIITLPYPFHGTDNTVFNGTAYYNYNDMLIAYNVKTGDTKELQLNISTDMLYNNSNSRMDVQADEHGIWMLYRRKGEDYLTASRIQPFSLKVLSSWSLPAVLPSRFCNAIVRCGLLYTVECDVDNVTVSAIYDFYAHIFYPQIISILSILLINGDAQVRFEDYQCGTDVASRFSSYLVTSQCDQAGINLCCLRHDKSYEACVVPQVYCDMEFCQCIFALNANLYCRNIVYATHCNLVQWLGDKHICPAMAQPLFG
ncbi:unnamed protein product [Cylicocyclus nassatus]|uniref:Olfactomedin-like domain-containing protein n=1 Tax=Cylicocyclus nassatus TaxID=53992 RepID=A0AA36GN49_CYLNA|nr:unnamed protein product [Cylicocyclus nassatus]